MKNNYSMRIRSAITLTVAFSLILSGVYFAWLSPVNEYPNYKEIARTSTGLQAGATSQLTFDTVAGKKVSFSADASYYQPTDEHGQPLNPPSFSIKLYDPSGEIIMNHENVVYTFTNAISIENSGTYKIEITNKNNSTTVINAYVQDVSAPTTRPLEPVGHWFIFMALPIIGLGIWFAIVKIEVKPSD